jgi:hypothetical protein
LTKKKSGVILGSTIKGGMIMKEPVRLAVSLCLAVTLILVPVASRADQYDDSQSNPLRVTAYLLNPFGVALEWVIFRPFHWLVSATKPQEYIFGHRPHPPLIDSYQSGMDYGVSQKAPGSDPAPSKNITAAEPTAEKAVIQEGLVEKPVAKEAPGVVETPGESQAVNAEQTQWAKAPIRE